MALLPTGTTIAGPAPTLGAQICPIIFDGRIPDGSTPDLFDTEASPFGTKFVKASTLKFSDIIKLPDMLGALFDIVDKTMPFKVTISDQSIFDPSPDNVQKGFRRAELQIDTNNGTDNSTLGLRTLHFTIRQDNERPLNASHEYQLVFLEDASFSTNQFVLKTGKIAGQPGNQDPNLLVLQGNVNAKPVVNLFKTNFTADVDHNFALTLDFNANKTTVLYSTGLSPLAVVADAVTNDISGQGQYHFGLLKKPSGRGIKDVTKDGFQPGGIDEGIVYGGIYMEDSTGNCVSLGG